MSVETRCCRHTDSPDQPAGVTRQAAALRRVVAIYVAECCDARTEVQASELALRLRISLPTLSAKFRRIVGRRLGDVLRCEQMRRASHLLLTVTPATIPEIARASGFGTARAFFRRFRAFYGMSPAAFRQQLREPA